MFAKIFFRINKIEKKFPKKDYSKINNKQFIKNITSFQSNANKFNH